MRAASAIQRVSRPAICTEPPTAPAAISALARTSGLAATSSGEATISDTTRPAPKPRDKLPDMAGR